MQIPMRKARKWRMFLLDLFFPNRCPCCHRLIPWDRNLCDACIMAITVPEDTFCPGCGKRWDECCCDGQLDYDCAFSIAFYAGLAKSGILSMKKARSLQFGWHCAYVFAQRIFEDPALHRFDLIVPVPMAKAKLRVRGCNPAQVLAKELSLLTNIPLREDLLQDNGTGKEQHTLSQKERASNVAQFQAGTADLTGLRVILCDDVLTTGATMNRCAALLKSMGAAEVGAFAATVTVLHSDKPTIPEERKDPCI